MAEIRLAAEGGFDLRVGDADKPPRSKGIHLSGVLRSIAIEGGYLKEDDEELDDLIESTWTEQAGEDGRLVRVAIGLAWEDWLYRQPAYSHVIYHPGEVYKDGIAGSPDGIGMKGEKVWLEECKSTYKSMRRPVEEAWLWLEQCRGYCVMLGFTEAVLRVLYMRGDYRKMGPAIFRSYEVTFEEEELKRSWDRILLYKDRAKVEA